MHRSATCCHFVTEAGTVMKSSLLKHEALARIWILFQQWWLHSTSGLRYSSTWLNGTFDINNRQQQEQLLIMRRTAALKILDVNASCSCKPNPPTYPTQTSWKTRTVLFIISFMFCRACGVMAEGDVKLILDADGEACRLGLGASGEVRASPIQSCLILSDVRGERDIRGQVYLLCHVHASGVLPSFG